MPWRAIAALLWLCASGLVACATPPRLRATSEVRTPAAPIGGEISAVTRQDLWLRCGALRCAAWLYRPASVTNERVPVVVMAHGFGFTREVFLPEVARRFAERGLAVLLFDYRHFGESDGKPRERLRVPLQLEDWRSAVAAARALEGIDPERVALFGTSFSGGHVLEISASDSRVRAVVAQVPFSDGAAGERAPFAFRVRAGLAILLDYAVSAIGLGPVYVPVIGAPGTFAAQTSEVTYRAFSALEIPPSWRNQIPARAMLEIGAYFPGRSASRIQAPLLLVATRDDELVPLSSVERLARAAPRAVLRVEPGTHFDVYGPPLRDAIVRAQAEFLTEHLAR